MNNLLNIKTPAQAEATALKSDYGLESLGLSNLRQAYWNLPVEALVEEIVFRGEAKITHQGPIVANTGKHTARSANDKFVVREPESEADIWWGSVNVPIAPEKFELLRTDVLAHLGGQELFVRDVWAGADPRYRIGVRSISPNEIYIGDRRMVRDWV